MSITDSAIRIGGVRQRKWPAVNQDRWPSSFPGRFVTVRLLADALPAIFRVGALHAIGLFKLPA
jgi:hypothetical protein